MIYEVIRKMAWKKFQCWNGLLRPYVEIVRIRSILQNIAIPLRLKSHRFRTQILSGAVPKVFQVHWVRNLVA